MANFQVWCKLLSLIFQSVHVYIHYEYADYYYYEHKCIGVYLSVSVCVCIRVDVDEYVMNERRYTNFLFRKIGIQRWFSSSATFPCLKVEALKYLIPSASATAAAAAIGSSSFSYFSLITSCLLHAYHYGVWTSENFHKRILNAVFFSLCICIFTFERKAIHYQSNANMSAVNAHERIKRLRKMTLRRSGVQVCKDIQVNFELHAWLRKKRD